MEQEYYKYLHLCVYLETSDKDLVFIYLFI